MHNEEDGNRLRDYVATMASIRNVEMICTLGLLARLKKLKIRL